MKELEKLRTDVLGDRPVGSGISLLFVLFNYGTCLEASARRVVTVNQNVYN